MAARAYSDVVCTELADLLPVSEEVCVLTEVHVASYSVAVAAYGYARNKRTRGLIAVENLNAAGQELESRTLPVEILSHKTCIVRGEVCKHIVVGIAVDIGCVLGVHSLHCLGAAETAGIGRYRACDREVDH